LRAFSSTIRGVREEFAIAYAKRSQRASYRGSSMIDASYVIAMRVSSRKSSTDFFV
jgi:hypothetical protein